MATTKSQGIYASELSRARPRPEPPGAPASGALDAGEPTRSVGRTGVVFVHGIGSQKPAETLLQWSAPIIEVLTAWHGKLPTEPPDPGPRDPVLRATIDFSSTLPTISLRVPAATTDDAWCTPSASGS